MPPLKSGHYYIYNVKHNNVVYLPNRNSFEPVRGKLQFRRAVEDTGELWKVSAFGSGKYSIQNVKHTSYASTRSGYNLDPNTVAVEGKVPQPGSNSAQYFRIEETKIKGRYTICTTDSQLYWFLDEGEHDTPIGLSRTAIDSSCWWTFKSPPPLEVHCTITFNKRRASFPSGGIGSKVTLEDDGAEDDTWTITLISGSKYFIQDFDAETYLAPNDENTHLVLSENRYSWTIKPHPTQQKSYRISTGDPDQELVWVNQKSGRSSYIGLTEASSDNGACQIQISDEGGGSIQKFDYQATNVTAENFAGHLNSIHPGVQKRAIENIQTVITDEDMMTEELLEALVLLKCHSGQKAKAHAAKSVANILFDLLKSKTPSTTRKLITQLLEDVVKDSDYMDNLSFKISPGTMTSLMGDLRSEDEDVVISACRVLQGLQMTTSAKINMQSIAPLLHSEKDDVVAAALELLLSTIEIQKKKPDEQTSQRVLELVNSPNSDISSVAANVAEEEEKHEKRIASSTSNVKQPSLPPPSSSQPPKGQSTAVADTWVQAHKKIDTGKLYYIRNRATGRYWSYVGGGMDGYVVSDRNLYYRAAFCQWILSVNPSDDGMTIATAHAFRPKAQTFMTAAMSDCSFYFMPVPDEDGWYFIASSIKTTPPTVVTAREVMDESGPSATSPLSSSNQYQMWQLVDSASM
ncbi:hypothetical protein AMATHDRAFT_70632 [Amanita thiersii Skay4041]|uniref:Ricin B lectin domain-containing protein n=1 Tax=Amanita thiersii Skay4041 TaxID=703135 RepID=A0A2A9NEF6_9AGAR|nr:hypothetical protein AMATHDRAFT_70632 [Amanita thiersii Skay4041]